MAEGRIMAYDCSFAGAAALAVQEPDNKDNADYEIVIVVKKGGVVRFENNIWLPHLEGTNGDGI
jgi:hypothetical protein